MRVFWKRAMIATALVLLALFLALGTDILNTYTFNWTISGKSQEGWPVKVTTEHITIRGAIYLKLFMRLVEFDDTRRATVALEEIGDAYVSCLWIWPWLPGEQEAAIEKIKTLYKKKEGQDGLGS